MNRYKNFATSVMIGLILISCNYTIADSSNKNSIKKVVNLANIDVHIQISKAPFILGSHKIVYSKSQYIIGNHGDTTRCPEKIDGHKIMGTDGEFPRNEISQFQVKWGKKEIVLPPNFYNDCYEPSFDEDNEQIVFVPSDEENQILIEMKGSDGAGVYTVYWIISENGAVKRFIYLSDLR